MQTKMIECTNQIGARDDGSPKYGNWGKFVVCRFTREEWGRRSAADPDRWQGLIASQGWAPNHLLVVDLATGEGAIFAHGGHAKNDLDKHRIWVCPLFEPFLEWLYTQDVSDLDALPDTVHLPDAEFMFAGYRRAGPEEAR